MADDLHKPHDGLFQWTFSNLERARNELAAILPPALLRHVDLSTLELCSIGSADAELQRFEFDLFYTVRIIDRPGLLYLVFEHQSTVDLLMPLRMGGRIIRTLEWWARQKQRRLLPLPVVLPVVLHHSEKGWTAETRFEALFDPVLLAEPEIAALVPHFGFVLDDISHLSDEELARRALGLVATLALWALRDGRRSLARLKKSFRYWARAMSELARQGPEGKEALRRILGYLMGVNDALTPDSMRVMLRELPSEAKETMMTLAEQLKAEGKAEGKADGIAEGRRDLLLRQLVLKFGEVPEETRHRIEAADEVQLIAWAEHVLSAVSLDDVLGE